MKIQRIQLLPEGGYPANFRYDENNRQRLKDNQGWHRLEKNLNIHDCL